MEPIYIVGLTMSSPNRVLNSKEINEGMTLEVNYLFKKETRQKIAAVRTLHKKPIYKDCLDFYGLFFMCKDSQKESIQVANDEADKKLKAIDSSLSSSIIFMPLNMAEVTKGEMYKQILDAIEYRILSDLTERLETVAKTKTGQLPERSKEAMIKMIDRLKSVNVMNDENIEKKLSKIRDKIVNNDLDNLKADFTKEIAALNQRGAYLEYKDD